MTKNLRFNINIEQKNIKVIRLKYSALSLVKYLVKKPVKYHSVNTKVSSKELLPHF